ncbi:MAG: hypothetical protein ABI794_03650 [Betaproteobacteria bacterium]
MQTRSRLLFPLMVVAAVSVVVFSGIGLAAITGHLRLGHGGANPATEFSFPTSKASAKGKAALLQQLGAGPCLSCGKVRSIESMTPDALAAASGGPLVMRDPNGSTAGNLTAPDAEKAATGYVVRLQMDDGTSRIIQEHAKPPFSVGQRVRLMNGLVLTLG